MNTTKVEIFIVGAPKAGTSSVYHFLNDHSEVVMCDPKEPNYFTQAETKNLYTSLAYSSRFISISNEDEYHALFSSRDARKGEASVSYLFYPGIAQRIKAYNPDSKIVICLRNPVDRAISHHAMDYRLGFTKKNIDYLFDDKSLESTEYQQYVLVGQYSEQVARYISEFGRDRVKVIWFDKLKEYPEMVRDELCDFLSISPSNTMLPHRNKAKETNNKLVKSLYASPILRASMKRVFSEKYTKKIKNLLFKDSNKSVVSNTTRSRLWQYFEADITQLEKILDVNLSNWKSSCQVNS